MCFAMLFRGITAELHDYNAIAPAAACRELKRDCGVGCGNVVEVA
jgi:hypothetical protein